MEVRKDGGTCAVSRTRAELVTRSDIPNPPKDWAEGCDDLVIGLPDHRIYYGRTWGLHEKFGGRNLIFQSPNLEMGSGISRQIWKWEIINLDEPDQNNGTR
ncbi:hypothetical protein TNCV_4990911 [Trichonephila clavipes]|nr:hypothetical protein TNCV_4990911 [Trichonephila clavipes]